MMFNLDKKLTRKKRKTLNNYWRKYLTRNTDKFKEWKVRKIRKQIKRHADLAIFSSMDHKAKNDLPSYDMVKNFKYGRSMKKKV